MANEKRLIDANVLTDDTYILNGWDAPIIRAWLADQPTVDAVEVVRCKDCIHYEKDTMWCEMCNYPKSEAYPLWYADDFCSYGERRTDDAEN